MGGQKFSAPKARIFRSGASRGAHIRALFELLLECEERLPPEPHPRRARIRTVRAMLVKAYPEFLAVSEVDLAWDLEGDASPD